jgi:toxin HigB-1
MYEAEQGAPMIRNFADACLEHLIAEGPGPKTKRIPPDLYTAIARKIGYLNQAVRLEDLRVPPANRLERLKGDLADYYSIRVNNQFRILFRREKGEACDVSFQDYH